MKLFFRAFVAVFVAFYRLTGGRVGGTMLGIPVLIVTMTGRKSGKRRTVPLGYVALEGGYVVTASGSSRRPAWTYNLAGNPRVQVELKRQHFDATAEALDADARERLWPQMVAAAPAYGRYEKRPPRDIPMFILRPDAKRPPESATSNRAESIR